MKTADALGMIELTSMAYGSLVEDAMLNADVAAKAANVQLVRLQIAMAMGGKGLVMMTGSVADCRAGVEAGAAIVKEKGLLVAKVVIPGPSKELFAEYL